MSSSTETAVPAPGRLHIVLVPGFAGFDALGQLQYYTGVTQAFRDWGQTATGLRAPWVLHHFDDLPTPGVRTRAARLRRYLDERRARGEIQDGDRVALVGHSTGGLDIRRLLSDLAGIPDNGAPPVARLTPSPPPPTLVDGGAAPVSTRAADTTGPALAARATAVPVHPDEILEAIDAVVFLSVPQFGTNIADWTRARRVARQAVVADLLVSVEAARLPLLDAGLTGLLRGLGAVTGHPDLLLAARDALTETVGPVSDPTRRAAAQEASSQLRLWLQHALDDFAAIDDLTARRRAGSTSPAHASPEHRDSERALWRDQHIRTMSMATLGRRAFTFGDGPVRPLRLTDPFTWRKLAPGVTGRVDLSYLLAYRACAGGPFTVPTELTGYLDIDALNMSLFDPAEVMAGTRACIRRIQPWDNDGIVNTASMLWPDGAATWLVAGDHGDIVGHFVLRRAVGVATGRDFASYDLLRSASGFEEVMFAGLDGHLRLLRRGSRRGVAAAGTQPGTGPARRCRPRRVTRGRTPACGPGVRARRTTLEGGEGWGMSRALSR